MGKKETVKSGEYAPSSGILQCKNCGHEQTTIQGNKISPCQKCGKSEHVYVKKTT